MDMDERIQTDGGMATAWRSVQHSFSWDHIRGQLQNEALSERYSLYMLKAVADQASTLPIRADDEGQDERVALFVPISDGLGLETPSWSVESLRTMQPMWAMADEDSAVLAVPPGSSGFLGLSISARMLEDYAHSLRQMHPVLKYVLHDRLPPFAVMAKRDKRIIRAVQDVLTAPFHGAVRTLYLEAKALELIALCLASGEQKNAAKGLHGDADRLHEVRERLMNALDAPPSIDELARAVGMTRRRLCNGFREYFGVSIDGAVREARLVRARHELEATDRPVKAIAFEAGYTHVSNFTLAFTRQFGISPTEWRVSRRGRI